MYKVPTTVKTTLQCYSCAVHVPILKVVVTDTYCLKLCTMSM